MGQILIRPTFRLSEKEKDPQVSFEDLRYLGIIASIYNRFDLVLSAVSVYAYTVLAIGNSNGISKILLKFEYIEMNNIS